MANFTLSPSMNLPIPVVGVDGGPDYATNVNSSFTIVDGHNHTAGYGVQIPPAGLNINSDLTFQGNNAINVNYLRFLPVGVNPPDNVNTGYIYEFGVDLWYVDGNGTPIQLTQNGSIKGTTGTISGMTGTTASASYVLASKTFVFSSNSPISANIDAASYLLRNISPNSTYALTLSPPNLTSNYTITLPILPLSSSSKYVTIDPSGNMGTQSADQIGESMTSAGADPIGEAMTSVGADAVANSRTRTVNVEFPAPANQIYISNILSSFFTASTSDVAVPPLGATITSSAGGRPIIVGLTPAANGSPSYLSIINSGPSGTGVTILGGTMTLSIYKNGTPIAVSNYSSEISVYTINGSSQWQIPIQAITFFDVSQTPNTATTYQVYIRVTAQSGNTGNVSVGVINAQFYAYEI